MRRREFIKIVAAWAAAWSLETRAQQSKVPRVGALYIGLADEASFKTALREGLRELGYVEEYCIRVSLRGRKTGPSS